MEKILSLILSLTLIFSLVACGNKTSDTDLPETDEIITDSLAESDAEQEEKLEETQDKEDNDKETTKPETKPEEKPQVKPEEKPQVKPEEKPQVKPEEKPQDTPVVNKTLGNILLSEFMSKAGAGLGVEAIGNALMSNPSIKFGGGVIPVEPGLLSGFDNHEVKGFKTGVMCAPMIGSIAFVSYVFELDGTVDAQTFVSNLRSNANLRWNICVEAEEMVTGISGNKVFFVMCPKSLEE